MSSEEELIFAAVKLGESEESIASRHEIPVSSVQQIKQTALARLSQQNPADDVFLTLARLEDMYRALAPDIEHGNVRSIQLGRKILMDKMAIYGLGRPANTTSETNRGISELLKHGGEEALKLLEQLNRILEEKE